ncbi:hypothetical protein PQX77_012780 [Marasmius sp. AFHP31]|nr:hypothetical protein PQX77_012780 [Marasmius sp. AFHP31]
MGTADVPTFTVTSFSVNPQSSYQSTCGAATFNDENLISWLRTHDAMDKGVSTSEEEGFLYIFRIDGVDFSDVTDLDLSHTAAFKVGRTVSPPNRERQWHRQCPSQTHTWYEPVWVEQCHLVERLVHAALEEICVLRPRKACSDCGCVHHEIFLLSDLPDTVKDVVALIKRQRVIARMSGGRDA